MKDLRDDKQQTHLGFFRLGVKVVVLFMLMSSTALAERTRSCRATVIVDPVEHSAPQYATSFSVHATVAYLTLVNQARRWARQWAVECIQAHWADRDAPQPPSACRRIQAAWPDIPVFPGYPFTRMSADLGKAICDRNPDKLAVVADVKLQIRGDTGCIRGGGTGVDPHEEHLIADDFRFACPGRIGEGGGFENVEPPPTATEPGFNVMPNTRLPGNDLGVLDVSDGDWRACMAACAANGACQAWTYRNRFQGVSSVCLLKRAAGPVIADSCCRSGVRQ